MYKADDFWLSAEKSSAPETFIDIPPNFSWSSQSRLDLHETVMLLTEEYVATKSALPDVEAIECTVNSDSADSLNIIVVPQGASELDIDSAATAVANSKAHEVMREYLHDSSKMFIEILNYMLVLGR